MKQLRRYIPTESPEISDAELQEFSDLVEFDNFLNPDEYEFAGNFIITKDIADRDEAVFSMCCGIIVKDVPLSNGEIIYFAFDYGH